MELITGRVTNFNIKGEGEEKETVSGLRGFGRLVVTSLLCNSLIPIDAVRLKT